MKLKIIKIKICIISAVLSNIKKKFDKEYSKIKTDSKRSIDKLTKIYKLLMYLYDIHNKWSTQQNVILTHQLLIIKLYNKGIIS